jgi:hypothetical protein
VLGVHGARSAEVGAKRVTLSSPALFLGARQGSNDSALGRRGGGGGWFVRLEADTDPGQAEQKDAVVATITATYYDALTGAEVEQVHELHTPLGKGNNPGPMDPYFSDATRAKSFMMLNMYFALDASLDYFEQGDCASGSGMADMMAQSYLLWSKIHQDEDINADMDLLVSLSENIYQTCRNQVSTWPVWAPVSCFYW